MCADSNSVRGTKWGGSSSGRAANDTGVDYFVTKKNGVLVVRPHLSPQNSSIAQLEEHSNTDREAKGSTPFGVSTWSRNMRHQKR